MDLITQEIRKTYSEPVSQLLQYGECSIKRDWADYLSLGLSEKDIPELIGMFNDKDLQYTPSDSIEVWAPVHAWRTLGQLKAKEAIMPIINFLEDEENDDDDWSREELPIVLGMIGEPCIEPIKEFLFDPSKREWAKILMTEGLEDVAKTQPTSKEQCIRIFTDLLSQSTDETIELNGFIVASLLNLQASESIGYIRTAFEKDIVDCTIAGDVEDAEISLGVRTERSTPRRNYLKEKYNFSDFPQPFVRTQRKIGRNEPCPCGSGKKYKKCCLSKGL